MDRAKVIFNVDQNSDISKNLVDFRYQFLIEKGVNKNSIPLDYSVIIYSFFSIIWSKSISSSVVALKLLTHL